MRRCDPSWDAWGHSIVLEKSTLQQSVSLLPAKVMAEEVVDVCEQCQGEAMFFCLECRHSYCSSCSQVRHKVGRRKEHSVSRLSLCHDVAHVSLDEDTIISAGQFTHTNKCKRYMYS